MFPTRHHQAVRAFCQTLFANDSVVYFSQLLRAELLQTMRAIGTDPLSLTPAMRRRYQLHRWGDRPVARRAWLRYGMQQFEAFISQFYEANEVALDQAIVDDALDIMANYQIASYDAIHVATACAVGVAHLAAVDADFERVRPLMIVHIVHDSEP
jgi:predicted nucleic acid-binding protein